MLCLFFVAGQRNSETTVKSFGLPLALFKSLNDQNRSVKFDSCNAARALTHGCSCKPFAYLTLLVLKLVCVYVSHDTKLLI